MAERMVDEIMKFRYLAQQIESDKAAAFDTVVVRVTNFGLFVEIPELQIQGLVHVSSLADQFVPFDRRKATLTAGNTVYRVGSRLKARPKALDMDARRVDFEPVGGLGGGDAGGRRKSASGARKRRER
jgi:ribonuclease R